MSHVSRSWVIALAVLLLPFAAHATTIDLSISASGISFSKPIIAGDNVRIYAAVKNIGEVDVAGYVSFFQGSIPIGDSQVISMRANGVTEEVYVDFVVPSGTFNIRAEIRGTDPQDVNSTNDVAVTQLFTPLFDDDRDGIENEQDNCLSVDNVDQIDTDGDGAGDTCDEDDDNDTLTDGVESELGTNPRLSDTDGDGVTDPNDAYPLDPTRSKVPPPPPAPAPAPVPVPKPEPQVIPAVAAVTEEPVPAAPGPSTSDTAAEPVLEEESEQPAFELVGAVEVSPRAVFSYARLDWNEFEFTALAPSAPDYVFRWDFGNGVTSSRHSVAHKYRRSGDFTVTFTVTDPEGNESTDMTVISVPFFTMKNPIVVGLVSLLGLLLLFGIVLAIRLSSATKKSRRKESEEDEEDRPETEQNEE